jgi:hypothetical protein
MVLGVAAACGRNEAAGRDTATQAAASDSAAGVTPVDTTTTTATLTPAAPAPPPTAADANVVRDALESKLTEDNLKKFMNAGSRLAFLRARDAQLRGSLQSMGASREKTDDAALARLEHNAQISKAISDAGLSVRDYYTMSLAIASARRFVGNPGAAPPTPTLRDNAKFLRDHKQQLAHLRVWGQ